nr:MAG TPA: hypothetical protein [Caudoviricetes sp.]
MYQKTVLLCKSQKRTSRYEESYTSPQRPVLFCMPGGTLPFVER